MIAIATKCGRRNSSSRLVAADELVRFVRQLRTFFPARQRRLVACSCNTEDISKHIPINIINANYRFENITQKRIFETYARGLISDTTVWQMLMNETYNCILNVSPSSGLSARRQIDVANFCTCSRFNSMNYLHSAPGHQIRRGRMEHIVHATHI